MNTQSNYSTNSKWRGIEYLYSLAQWNKEKEFTLDSINKVLNYLNNPQNDIASIIVSGTNGKGSVSAMISSILGASGHTVALNTSPHLFTINERIIINGASIQDAELSNIGIKIQNACNEINTKLSFHEAITLAAFIAAKNANVDWHVLEVGLGGRLDAANTVLDPRLSILVSVDYDHQALLGNSLEKIALEKAGIFRKNGTAIIGELSEEPRIAISQYIQNNTIKSICYKSNFEIKENADGNNYFQSTNGDNFLVSPILKGNHQIVNTAIAIAACRSLEIDIDSCAKGVSNVFWPGRLETLNYNDSEILLDCGHNPAGINSLISYFKSRSIFGVSLGFGVLSSKNWQEMVDILIPYVKDWNLLTSPTESAVASSTLEEYLHSKGISAKNYDKNYLLFLQEVCRNKANLQVITGSIYLVGAIRGMITEEIKPVWQVLGGQ